MRHIVLIAEVKWTNMTFKNRLRSLTLKRLVCLPEFFLESVDSSAISAQKWWSLRFLSSRKITKSLVLSTEKLLKSWLNRLLWLTLPISFPFQLQLSFASSMTSVLSMIAFLRLCLGTLKQSGEWLFQSRDEDEFHFSRFWQSQYHHSSGR